MYLVIKAIKTVCKYTDKTKHLFLVIYVDRLEAKRERSQSFIQASISILRESLFKGIDRGKTFGVYNV